MIANVFSKLKNKKKYSTLRSVDAYRLWSESYDDQPDNVVLYLEEKMFSEMISGVDMKGKRILDIGSGTGRHWKELLDCEPLILQGADSSYEMTEKLKRKFPEAEIFIVENNSLKKFGDADFNIIVSTLTIGHIKEIEEYFREWNRVLKTGGEIIITDFHPEAFSIGMKRTFTLDDAVIEVENHLHTLEFLRKTFGEIGWKVMQVFERLIDDDVKFLFEKQKYLKAYKLYYKTPLILGLHLCKE